MTTRPLIRQSLWILNISGLNPIKYNKFKFIFSELVMGALTVETLLKCLYSWRGLQSMEDIAIALGCHQVNFKILIMVWNRKEFQGILNDLERFTPGDRFEWNIQNQIDKISSSFERVSKIMLITLLGIVCFYFSKPFVSASRILPFQTYHPTNLNHLPSYIIAFCFNITVPLVALPCLIGFDMLFVAFILNISWEFRMMKFGLETTAMVEDNLSALHDLIAHHNLILRSIKKMNGIYTIFLLNTFVQNMLCICVGLLCIIASGFPPSFQVLSQYGLFLIFYTAQVFFYCSAGTYLTSESEDVSRAVFETNWWARTEPRVRRACACMIQRANKTERLTAGGMLTLNLATFTQVVRMGLSFFTLVQALYG